MQNFASWLGGIGAVLLATLSPAAADSCRLKQLASVEAELDPADKLMIHTRVDDQPTLMQLDTGAAVSVMFQYAVDRWGLSHSPARALAAGSDGIRLAEITTVPSLALGNLVSEGTRFPISPMDESRTANAAGLFGADYLRNYDVEIDLADRKVNLFSQDHCKGKVVYWANEYNATDVRIDASGWIKLYVELDGTSIEALLDTGADANFLDLRAAHNRFGLSPDSPDMVPGTAVIGAGGGAVPGYRHIFKSLKLGDLTIQNPRFTVVPSAEGVCLSCRRFAATPDITIGMNLLKHLRLYIAYEERRIYYTVSP